VADQGGGNGWVGDVKDGAFFDRKVPIIAVLYLLTGECLSRLYFRFIILIEH
jgi:hypothetical protein